MRLTDTAVRTRKPGPKAIKMSDGGGLYLLLNPKGMRWWRWDYRRPVTGKRNTLSLGTYPEISLAEARSRRDDVRRQLALGIDPGEHRHTTKAASLESASNSFEAVAREWLAIRAHEWTAGQLKKERSRLENHAFPWIGKVPVSELGVSQIRPLIERVSKAGHLEQAHRLRFQISRVFQFAIASGRADRDPAGDLKAVLPSRRKQNFATITDPKKVGQLLRAIDGFEGTFTTACALKLAPLLFCRPGELRAAEWSEFDLSHPEGPQWVIPATRRKLRKAEKENPNTPPHIVPLCTQAVAILDELRPLTGSKRFLFPGARDPKRPMSDMTINAALRRLGYEKEEMTGHGFRHMATTLLNELGFNRDAIERQMAHKEPGVRGVYNKAQHLPERRQMMQAWADYLDGLKSGAKVVPLSRTRQPST